MFDAPCGACEMEMENDHDAWLAENFRVNLDRAKKLLALGQVEDARWAAHDAQEGATTAGQRRLAAALNEAIARKTNLIYGS